MAKSKQAEQPLTMTEMILKSLAEPIPQELIKQREGAGGMMLDYIEWTTTADRLDAVYPEWNHRIVNQGFHTLPKWKKDRQGNWIQEDATTFWVIVELEVAEVRRESFGQGSDYKSAEHDALKRVGVHFGIGRELYTKSVSYSGESARPAPSKGNRAPMQGEATLKQRHAVEKIGVSEGFNNVEDFVAEYGFEWDSLSKQEASNIIEDVMSQRDADKQAPKAPRGRPQPSQANSPEYDDDIPF